MKPDYDLFMEKDLVVARGVGPVIDLRGLDKGIEGKLTVEYGEGDQKGYATYEGTLRHEGKDGFALHSTRGQVIPLDVGDIGREIAWHCLELKVPVELDFLRAWIDCYFSFDRGAHICPNFQKHQSQPQKIYRGLIDIN